MPRYIDADKLISKPRERYDALIDAYEIGEEYAQGFCGGFCEALDTAEAISDETSSADVQEVKHGKWIRDRGWYSHHCSYCGRSTSSYIKEDGDLYDRVFNLCPNCGAKMDGDEQ